MRKTLASLDSLATRLELWHQSLGLNRSIHRLLLGTRKDIAAYTPLSCTFSSKHSKQDTWTGYKNHDGRDT